MFNWGQKSDGENVQRTERSLLCSSLFVLCFHLNLHGWKCKNIFIAKSSSAAGQSDRSPFHVNALFTAPVRVSRVPRSIVSISSPPARGRSLWRLPIRAAGADRWSDRGPNRGPRVAGWKNPPVSRAHVCVVQLLLKDYTNDTSSTWDF